MASYNTTANVILSINGKQAQKMLAVLEKDARKLEQQIAKAARAGDKATMTKLQRSLNSTKRTMDQLKGSAFNVENVLRRMDQATPKELNRAIKTLQQQLNGLQRGTAAWDSHVAKIKALKAELQKVNATMNTQRSLWTRFNMALNNAQTFIISMTAALAGLVAAGRRAVTAYADMEEQMANTRKYTGMTEQSVLQLNEAFKNMNTRTGREKLNEFAQEAGRLGKKTLEDVQGYVEAANIVSVALVDLGEGATQTIAKISNIFGMEELYGVKDAMLKVGSTVNVLSQNCTASKPYLVEFAQRMAGIGSQAKMTVPEILAFAATLDANGQKVEMSASALSRTIMKLFQEPEKIAKSVGLNVNYFMKVLANDTTKGIMMFLEKLNEIGEENALAALSPLFKDLGMDGIRMAQVLSNLSAHLDMLKWEIGEANKAFREGTSATNEYNIFNNTVQANIEKAKYRVHELAVELGEKLYPVMRHIYTSSSFFLRVLNQIVSFIVQYRVVIGTLVATITAYYVAVGLATVRTLAYNAAVVLCERTVTTFKYVVGLLQVAFIALTHGTKAAGTAFTFLNSTMKANPFGLVVAGATALYLILKNLIGEVDDFKSRCDKATESALKWEEATLKEQHELDILIGKLQGAEKGTDAYESAKTQIINQYGKYLSGLINEKGEIIDLTKAYDRLTKAVQRSAQARGIAAAKASIEDDYYKGVAQDLESLQRALEASGLSATDASKVVTKVGQAMATGKPLDSATIATINAASANQNDFMKKLGNNVKKLFGEEPIGNPARIVNTMLDNRATKDKSLANLKAMENAVMPYNNFATRDLKWAIESLQGVIKSGQAGNAMILQEGSQQVEYTQVSVKQAQELLDLYQEELALRGTSDPSPKKFTNNDYPHYSGSGSGKDKSKSKEVDKTSDKDRFKAEDDYRAMRQAYALINKSLGYKRNEDGTLRTYTAYDYLNEMDSIEIAYYKKLLDRTDLTWLERLQMESKYQAAIAKKQEDFEAESIERENKNHTKKVAEIRQQYMDELLTTDEYNKKLEDEDVRHLGVIADLYEKFYKTEYNNWDKNRKEAQKAMEENFNGNVDLLNRPQVSGKDMKEKGYDLPEDSYATVYSSQVGIEDASGTVREILVTPILPDGSVLSEKELDDYIYNVLEGSSDILAADTKGLVIAIDVDPDGSAGEMLHELQEIFYAEKPVFDADGYNQWLQAREQYLQKTNQIRERDQRELEKLAKEHQDELDKMWEFMFPEEKNRQDYQKDLALLDEVYHNELEKFKDNEAKKLEIEEAYLKAKLMLRKKYGIKEGALERGMFAQFAEWLESDGGKAVLQSVSTISSGLSEIFTQVNSLMQAELDIQTNAIEKKYSREIELAEGNSYKVAKLEKQKEQEIAQAKNEANRKMFAMQVIQAVAQTATNALNAYGSAAAIPVVGYIMAPIAAAMAVAAGAIQIAAIKKQQQASEAQGYSEGGFTPEGPKDKPVGVVHAGEWVASQKLVRSPQTRPLLEAMDYAQKNNTIGSLRMEDVSRSITAPMLLASQTPQPVIVQQPAPTVVVEQNKEYADTMKRLSRRLNEPFVTVNTVTGDHGIQKAQSDYDKLMKNKSPKSRK